MSTAFVSEALIKRKSSNLHLPPLVRTESGWAPQAPKTIQDTGLDEWIINDLAIKLASTVPHCSHQLTTAFLRYARSFSSICRKNSCSQR